MPKTKAQIIAEAQVVKNATEVGENTATRVGGVLEDLADADGMVIIPVTGTSSGGNITLSSNPFTQVQTAVNAGQHVAVRVTIASDIIDFTMNTYSASVATYIGTANFSENEFQLLCNASTATITYRSTSNTFTTGESVPNVGIDATPTQGSDNLVKSGGVWNEVRNVPYLYNGFEVNNRSYSFASAVISSVGKYTGNSKGATIRYKCEGNMRYAISNPSGGRLIVASSPTALSLNQTFPHFMESADTTYCEYKTYNDDEYLYIFYWAASASSVNAGTALENLVVSRPTSLDIYSRGKISNIYNSAVITSRNIFNPEQHFLAGVNMETSGRLVSGYSNRGVVFVPVYGLRKVTITLFSSGVTATGCRYCWYDINRAATISAIGNKPVYGETTPTTLEVPEGAYFLGFLFYYAGVQLDNNGAPICMIEEGDAYTGYIPYNATTIGKVGNRPKDIYICAYNSERKYKYGSDYYCDGVNDELTLQEALNAVGDNGTLYVAPGTYYIDSFPEQSDGQFCAIQYQTSPQTRVKIKAYDQTPMREEGYSIINHCAVMRVKQACYNALDSNTEYSVFGVNAPDATRVWNGACFDIEGVGVMLPGNQKKIVAFDAYYAFCMMMFKCMATAIPNNAMPSVAGVDGCVGIRCTKGSNFGQESQINTCAMYGFGQGIAVMGEHYVITNVKTIYNKYGFTFNWYGSTDGGYTHPNTLINCCSEMDFNYPYFGQNTQRQSLTLIDFNVEHRNAAFAMGGNLATESTSGAWRGTIHYTIKVYGTDGYDITGNAVTLPFWAEGCGRNMRSFNDAQAQSVTSTTLSGYAPNMSQIVWCTDLNKYLICTNPDTKEWRDFAGNIVTI